MIDRLETHPAKYISPEEYAVYLGVRRRTLYLWIDKGALHAVKVGGLLRIQIEEAIRFASVPARDVG